MGIELWMQFPEDFLMQFQWRKLWTQRIIAYF